MLRKYIISKFYNKNGFDDNESHLLSYDEKQKSDILIIKTLIISAIIGAFSAILLYAPHQFFPHFFPLHEISHPIFGKYTFKWGFSLYGTIVGFIELFFLITLNLISVGYLSKIFHFPQKSYKNKEYQIYQLIDVSLGKKPSQLLDLGFNPHQGMSNWSISLFILITATKASLSNIGLKALLEGLAEIPYLDYLVGIPVFAFWNIYGTRIILQKARLRILATNVINNFVEEIRVKHIKNPISTFLFKEVLQFVSYTKKGFDHNHLYLMLRMQEVLCFTRQKVYCDEQKLIHRLQNVEEPYRSDLISTLILGFTIDGQLSKNEIKTLEKLNQLHLCQISINEVKRMALNFKKGESN